MADMPTPPPVGFDLTREEFERIGQHVLEAMWESVERGQEDPILEQASGGDIRALFDEPLPRAGVPIDEVVSTWTEKVLPHCRHNGHPRFFGYVVTSPDPIGILVDAMASAMNQGLTAWRSASVATHCLSPALRTARKRGPAIAKMC